MEQQAKEEESERKLASYEKRWMAGGWSTLLHRRILYSLWLQEEEREQFWESIFPVKRMIYRALHVPTDAVTGNEFLVGPESLGRDSSELLGQTSSSFVQVETWIPLDRFEPGRELSLRFSDDYNFIIRQRRKTVTKLWLRTVGFWIFTGFHEFVLSYRQVTSEGAVPNARLEAK